MNLITRGVANTVILTLTERVTLTSPKFLCRVKSRRTNEIKRFILSSNSSSYTGRYDQFTITENDTDDLTNSQVKLLSGDWYYNIYEQSSTSNLDETQTNGTILESGIFRVLEDGSNTFNDIEQTDSYIDFV